MELSIDDLKKLIDRYNSGKISAKAVRDLLDGLEVKHTGGKVPVIDLVARLIKDRFKDE